MDTIPGVGHNRSGNASSVDLFALLDPQTLTDQWEMNFSVGLAKRDALLENVKKFKEKHPNGVTTETEAELASDICRQILAEAKIPASLHDAEKAPFLAAGRAADALFKHAWEDALLATVPYFTGDGLKGRPVGIVTKFHREKLERERLIREAEAKRLREEAEQAAAAAQRAMTVDVVDNAIQLDQQAEQARQAAKASTADMTRTRGSYGSVSSLRDNWTWELEDLMALVKAVAEGKAPLNYLTVNASVVSGAVRPKDGGVREVPGLKIWNASKSGVR